MKKLTAVFLFLCLLLSGCGKEAPAKPDLQAVYDKMIASEGMPEMLLVPANKAEMLFGIAEGDCTAAFTAICQDSLLADEIWLIDAKDSAAADRIESLAKMRLEQKASELKNYLPEQYSVVQQGKLIRQENRVALIVSPIVEKLAGFLQ